MEIQLNQALTQTQILSGRPLQSVRILQLNNMELSEYINNEMLSNPFLDMSDASEGVLKEDKIKKGIDWLNSTDRQNKAYHGTDYDGNYFDKACDKGVCVEEFLLEQLITRRLPENNYRACRYIIQSLDEKGYFDGDLKEMAKAIGISEQTALDSLNVIQSLEPSGIGARNVAECLKLQLPDKNDILIINMIEQDLLELSKGRFEAVARKYSVDTASVIGRYNIIKEMNPKPASSFGTQAFTKYILPDVIAVKNGGIVEVFLYDGSVPHISVSKSVNDLLNNAQDKETASYIRKKAEQAQWLVSCIEKRNETVLRAATEIVKRQKAFFLNGFGNLAPLKIADIAEELGLHESTVSRALKNKFIQCDYGALPFGYFFINKISGEDGSFFSVDDIKIKIKEIILNEGKSPLSDNDITKLLNKEGIPIKRRTVAKYRDELGFRPAAQRKGFMPDC